MRKQRGGRVAFTGEDFGDGRQSESEFPKQQDALQSHQGIFVVEAVAVGADAAWFQESEIAVMAQRSAGGTGGFGEFLDGPFAHVEFLLSDRLCSFSMQVDVASMSRKFSVCIVGNVLCPFRRIATNGSPTD